jgi:hypothetical protein
MKKISLLVSLAIVLSISRITAYIEAIPTSTLKVN